MRNEFLDYADRVWRGEASLAEYRDGVWTARGVAEVAEDVGFLPAFGNVVALRGTADLVLFDTSVSQLAPALHAAVRAWTDFPLRYAIYSHGHIDHVFGVGPFDAEPGARPVVVGHEAVPARFDRYKMTAGYNEIINQRQFGIAELRWPREYRYPDLTYRDALRLTVPGLTMDLRHGMGETDDATYLYLPDRKVLCTGDLFVWVSPNAGNPQKVQRYPLEWAEALRAMAGLGAELLLPGHGIPIQGADRIRTALTDTAEYLESLVTQTLELMNSGARLDDIVHVVTPPAHLVDKPYLQPVYDEPEFVVRNLWRRYGGWYDGNPANLKPAPDRELATALAELAGGVTALAERAAAASAEGDHRLAGHLAEFAALAAPKDAGVHRIRAQVFAARAEAELSTMAKGVYGWAAAESRSLFEGGELLDELAAANADKTRWAM